MIKHGLSHAGASLVSAGVAAAFGDVVVGNLPVVRDWLTVNVMPVLSSVGISLRETLVVEVCLIIGLSFVWGMAFKVMKSSG